MPFLFDEFNFHNFCNSFEFIDAAYRCTQSKIVNQVRKGHFSIDKLNKQSFQLS